MTLSSRATPVVLLASVATAGACAIPGTSTLERVGPPETVVQTDRILDAPYPEAWDRVVAALSEAPFELLQARRGAGIVEASFSSPDPEGYVDCGTTTRTYRRGGETATYTYPLAGASSYRWAMGLGSHGHLPATYEIHRDTELDARVRVRLVEEGLEAGTTRVGVTARYTLSIAVTGEYVLEAANGVPVDEGPIVPRTWEVSFRTNQPNWTDLGTEEDAVWVSCVSRGTLESRVLEMAGGGAGGG